MGYDPATEEVTGEGALLAYADPQVRADDESMSHSKRPVALSSRALALSFGYVFYPSLMRTIFKGGRQTRGIGAHSAL